MVKRLRRGGIAYSLLEKARESALLAVDIYNKPATSFRSASFVVLMTIAWTSLFHAIFRAKGIRPYYRDPKFKNRFLKVDEDFKWWELRECLSQYFKAQHPPERKNLELFIGLRNKIEHRNLPNLDPEIFGECQALLFNFEDYLTENFGTRYALHESLTLALQFSHLRNANQEEAIRNLHKPVAKDIKAYLDKFRSSLSSEQFADLKYSYRIFVVPKVENKAGLNELPVEFVRFDPSQAADKASYDQLTAIIKPVYRGVLNPDSLKAGTVAKTIEQYLKARDLARHFTASGHHPRVARYFNVRPKRGDPDKTKTDARYCHYDKAHDDYLYTSDWVEFLKTELTTPGRLDDILSATK